MKPISIKLPSFLFRKEHAWPVGFTRHIYVAVSMFECFTTSGLVFGWASLLPVIEDEGIYNEYCGNGEPTCEQQSVHLAYAFTIAASSNMVANLFLGVVFDRMGPRICKFLSLTLVALGCILLSFSHSRVQSPGFDLFLPGLSILAFGGTGIQLGSIHLSNLFPSYKSAISCFIVGSFQISFFVFLFFRYLIRNFGYSFEDVFLAYLLVVVLNFALVWHFSPTKPYQLEDLAKLPRTVRTAKGGNDISPPIFDTTRSPIRLPSVFMKKGEDLTSSTPEIREKLQQIQLELSASFETSPLIAESTTHCNDLKYRSFKTQLKSGAFVHLLVHFSIGMLWTNFFVASLHSQLQTRAGAVFIPIIGPVLVRWGFHKTLFANATLAMLYTVFFQFNSTFAMVFAFLLYSVFRTALFAVTFAYLGHCFGFQHFGVLSGILFALAAVFNLLQTAIAQVHSFTLLAVVQFVSYCVLYLLPWYESRNPRP